MDRVEYARKTYTTLGTRPKIENAYNVRFLYRNEKSEI